MDELALWHLDQKINDRGICIDLDLVSAAIRSADAEKKRLAKEVQQRTAGAVDSATQRDKLLIYLLAEYGVDLPDLQKSTLERRIEDPDLPRELRELLSIRLQASNASVSKYKALLRGVNTDGRLRGTIQFCGASRTGRDAGRTFQPQNLSRPPSYIKKAKPWEIAVQAVKAGAVGLMYENPMEVLGGLVRGAIIAPPGKKLVVGDLANIEGRKAAWLTGEDWKLQAFRDYDAGVGPDLYKLAYAKAFSIDPEDVGVSQRQIGKVMELMLQYEGGVGAYLTGAATYGINLDEMTEAAKPSIPLEVWEEAKEFLEWTIAQKRTTFGLADDTFIACDALKRMWRQAHPAIASYWREIKETVTRAINRPGESFACRRLVIRRDKAWLKIRLPSGRLLCYPSPQVDDDGQISYMGINQYSRKWQRIKTYGGKFFENVTQASSRDVFKSSALAIENDGFEIVLPVHDEWVAEAPDSPEFSVERLCGHIATVPEWAEGLPLAAAGFEGYRYRKD